jgi:hypothetical protein
MIGYDKKMNILRKDCVSSIQQPNFIDNLDPILARTAWSLTYNMVINFTEGLQKSVIPQWRCDLISREIMDISDDLSKILDGKNMLMIWLFIGEIVEGWIERAISLDCFESAENLKRILANSWED